MQYFILLVKLVPTIITLMGMAEKYFADKPDSGQEKKDLVMGVTGALVTGAEAVFTGGAADTWDRIKDSVSSIIDAGATIAFPHPSQDPRYNP